MNQNLRRSLWVVALGIAFTGLSTASVTAAVPAQQDRAQQDQNPDRSDNQRVDRTPFQQGLQDSQHDRQYGGNSSDHQQPTNSNDLRAYQDGYKQGSQNTTSGPKASGRAKRSIRFWRTRRG